MRPLLTHSRGRAMPRQQRDVVAKRPESVPDRAQQCCMVATRKVGSSDRTFEDHVADDRNPVPAVKKDHMPRRVTGTVVDIECLFTKTHLVALIQPAPRHERLAGRKTELTTPLRNRIEQETVVLVWSLDRQAELTRHAANRTGMVEMTVCDQDLLQLNARLLGRGQNAPGLATGIDNGRLAGRFAAQKGAVLLIGSHRDDAYFHKGKRTPAATELAKRPAAGAWRCHTPRPSDPPGAMAGGSAPPCNRSGRPENPRRPQTMAQRHAAGPTANGSTHVFAQWIGRGAKAHHLDANGLAALPPYQGLSVAQLKATLRQVGRIRVKEGLVSEDLPRDRRVFLERGSLQFQTQTGFVLALKADSPQARYPLPLKPAVISMYAAEPCTLLTVPMTAEAPAAPPPPPAAPKLDLAEADALKQLAGNFRKQRCELPSLPDLALKIGKAIDDPHNANEDIARLIQLDPSLTARLMSIVNSPAFGGFKKISTINQATTRLGRQKVRSLVYSCLIKSIFKINSNGLTKRMEALWRRSAHVAALSFVLGRETPGVDPEQAMLAALIHDIGTVAVIGGLKHFPLLARRDEVLDYVIASLRTEAGVLSLRQWGLQDEFTDVIVNAENWRRFGTAIPDNTDVVQLSLLHASIGQPRQAALPRIDSVPAFKKLARGRLTPHHSLSILEAAEADVQEVHSLLNVS